jgi:hypothetical protein
MNTVRTIASILAVAAASNLTGCASIVSGTNQVVSVETLSQGGKVDGAVCKLVNDKGTYFVTTPGTVTVHRAYGDMNVKCEKPGVPAGVASIKSSTKGMMAGNILFGGVIGAGVDAASGAAYDYPALFQIVMGEPLNVPAPAETASVATPAPAAAPQAVTAGGSQ